MLACHRPLRRPAGRSRSSERSSPSSAAVARCPSARTQTNESLTAFLAAADGSRHVIETIELPDRSRRRAARGADLARSMRDRLAMNSLAGRTVVITRAAEQAAAMSELVASFEAIPVDRSADRDRRRADRHGPAGGTRSRRCRLDRGHVTERRRTGGAVAPARIDRAEARRRRVRRLRQRSHAAISSPRRRAPAVCSKVFPPGPGRVVVVQAVDAEPTLVRRPASSSAGTSPRSARTAPCRRRRPPTNSAPRSRPTPCCSPAARRPGPGSRSSARRHRRLWWRSGSKLRRLPSAPDSRSRQFLPITRCTGCWLP